MAAELDRTHRAAVPGGTRAGNEGMRFGDVVQGTNQEEQFLLIMRYSIDPRKRFLYECRAGFIHVPYVNGVSRPAFEGDISNKELCRRYGRRLHRNRVEVFEILRSPFPISVPITARLSDCSYLDAVMTAVFEFNTCSRSSPEEFSETVEKLEGFLNGDFKESTVANGGTEVWTYLTASSMRKFVEAHLGSLARAPMGDVSSPLASLSDLRAGLLDIIRHDGLFARYGIRAVYADLSFGESQAERNQRLISELEAMAEVDRLRAEISHESNMVRIRFSQEETDSVGGA